MTISIDRQSSIPAEDQIRNSVREEIALGRLGPGDPIPSARQLAAQLGVHFTTVARAYRRLEEEGLLTVSQGKRITVKTATVGGRAAGQKELRAKLRQFLADAGLLGMSKSDLRTLFLSEMEKFAVPPARTTRPAGPRKSAPSRRRS
jgi:GntR family transcriptional regulator